MDTYVLNHVDVRQLGGGPLDPLSPGSPTPKSTTTSSSAAFSPSPTPSTPASRTLPSPVQPSTTSSTSSAPSSVSTASTLSSTDSSSTSATAQNSTIIPQPGNIPTANAAPSNSPFLQNKVASGLVFALVGIVSFVFLIFAITFFIKRRRNRRLHQEAISFDPHIDHEKGMYISGHWYNVPNNKHDPTASSDVFLLRPRANDRTPFTGSSPQS